MLHKVGEIIENSGFTQVQIADKLGIAPQNFSRMLKNDDIKLSVLTKLAEILKVPVSSLIVGEKPIKVVKQVVPDQEKVYHRMPQVVTVNKAGDDNIIYVPIKARAGYLLGYSDPEYIETLQTFNLPGLRNGTFRMFQADGVSMAPVVTHGDGVIASFVEDLETARDNRIHIIVTKDGVLIKRLLNRIKERGKFYMKSDTISHRRDYPTTELDPVDIVELWYGLFKISSDFSEPSEIYLHVNDLEVRVADLERKHLKK